MFFTQFGLLFANMEWYVLVCFIVGIACLLIEVFQPGFGVFGISGIVLMVLSIILRAIFHKEDDIVIMQVFQFLLIDGIFFGTSMLFLYISSKKGWFKKTSFFHTGTAVNEKFSDGTNNYEFLLGMTGSSATVLRPSGKVKIEGKLYDAESTGFLIEKGEKIKVVALEGSIVKVVRQEEIENIQTNIME